MRLLHSASFPPEFYFIFVCSFVCVSLRTFSFPYSCTCLRDRWAAGNRGAVPTANSRQCFLPPSCTPLLSLEISPADCSPLGTAPAPWSLGDGGIACSKCYPAGFLSPVISCCTYFFFPDNSIPSPFVAISASSNSTGPGLRTGSWPL